MGAGGLRPRQAVFGRSAAEGGGSPNTLLAPLSRVSMRSSPLIEQVTSENNRAVALLTFAFTMQALFVVGNVSRRLSEKLPFILFFLRHSVFLSSNLLTGEE